MVLDFGALFDGYCSDMTRTVLLGEPSTRAATMLDVVTEAPGRRRRRGRGRRRPARDVDAACRTVIDRGRLGRAFTHGTGHGVGLEIHEAPWVDRRPPIDTLRVRRRRDRRARRLPAGHGGVRIEDTVVVTEPTAAAPLTTTPKDLSCLRSPPTTSRTA